MHRLLFEDGVDDVVDVLRSELGLRGPAAGDERQPDDLLRQPAAARQALRPEGHRQLRKSGKVDPAKFGLERKRNQM